MSDTHRATPRYVIRPNHLHLSIFGPPPYQVIDTTTDEPIGTNLSRAAAYALAAHLNAQEPSQ